MDFVSTIPTMFLAAWGNLSHVIARALPHQPALSPRIMYASPADFHCYGAYLRLSDAHALEDPKLAAMLMRPPRDLVKLVLPESTDDLLIAFGKIAEPFVLTGRAYRRLDVALRGFGGAALLASSTITSAQILRAETLAGLDPLVGAADSLLGRRPDVAPHLHAILACLRSAECLGDEAAAMEVLRDADERGVAAFVMGRLAGARAPRCPFNLDGGLRHIDSVASLREAVGRLRPRDFLATATEFALVFGSMIVIEVTGDEPGLVLLKRELLGLYVEASCLGRDGARMSEATIASLRGALRRAGVQALQVDLAAAFDTIIRENIVNEELIESILDGTVPVELPSVHMIYHPQRRSRGQLVDIEAPTRASAPETWSDPSAIARFIPGGPYPAELLGIPMRPARLPRDPAEIAALLGDDTEDPPWGTAHARKAGAIVREADGRVWVAMPTNQFANTVASFPKGRIERGESARQTAWREVFEETGLVVRLERHLADIVRGDAVVRLYLAHRVGGTPGSMGWESQSVALVPLDLLDIVLSADKETAFLHEALKLAQSDPR